MIQHNNSNDTKNITVLQQLPIKNCVRSSKKLTFFKYLGDTHDKNFKRINRRN
jgi:hypothetical protein